MTVGRICSREVDTAHAAETVQTAAQRMLQRRVGSLVVVDLEERPIGILTDRDLALRVLPGRLDAGLTQVEDVMTPDPETIQEGQPIESAVSLMRSGTFRRVPVVNSQGQLVGVVTLDDIVSLLSEEITMIGELLAQQNPQCAALWS